MPQNPQNPPPAAWFASYRRLHHRPIRHLKASQWERERHHEGAARVKSVLSAAALPVMPTDTHIVPVIVGDPQKCKAATDLLLSEHGIYVQPINFPTVAR